MNYMKSALAMLAFLVVGIGTGLMVRVGIGANMSPGADVQWFDRSLVGASAGELPALFDTAPCEDCGSAIAWLEDAPRAARSGAASDEARRIAEHLDLQTVPMLLVSNDQITYVDLAQLESPKRITALH
jgi:hypothetical protein